MFGLNAARQPDGSPGRDSPGEYRKMRPAAGRMLFFDHPSGYNRIQLRNAMKSEDLQLFEKQIAAPAVAQFSRSALRAQ